MSRFSYVVASSFSLLMLSLFPLGDFQRVVEAEDTEPVPEDICILEMTLPAGAQATVDGRDYGSARQLRFGSLDPARPAPSKLRIRFAGGQEEEHTILVRGGWRIRLAAADPVLRRPDLVLQTGHSDGVADVAFSPDGKWVLTASHDGSVILWDAKTGQKLRTIADGLGTVESAAFSPDGKQVLVGAEKATLWDAATGQRLRAFQGEDRYVQGVAFSPDGRQVLIGAGQAATLWDAAAGRQVRTFAGHTSSVDAVAFSPDGRRIVTGSGDKTAALWDTGTGRRLRLLSGHGAGVQAVAVSPNGRQVLTGSYDQTAILWDADTGQRIHTLGPHAFVVMDVAFSPDGRQLLTCAPDATATLWDAAAGQILRKYQGSDGPVWSVAFRADGRQALLGSAGRTAVLWDTQSSQVVRRFRGLAPILSTAFSPAGRQVLIGSQDKAVLLWDAAKGRLVREFRGHQADVWSVGFSPDGLRVLTGSEDETAILWDAATGQKLRVFSGQGPIRHAAFGPYGQTVMTASASGQSLTWDAATGQRLRTGQGLQGLQAVALSPDGRQVLEGPAGPGSGTVVLRDAATRQVLRKLEGGHSEYVGAVAFSADGREVLTGSVDNTAMLWEAATGRRLRTFRGHADAVNAVAFRPDGRQVLTGSSDGTTRLWDVATGQELARVIAWDSVQDWLIATPHGLFDGSESGRQMVSFRVGEGLNIVPVDRFFQDFYRPGLLAELWGGARPLPGLELGKQAPPKVRIRSPESGGVDHQSVTVEVEATDQGGGVAGLSVFQNGARVLAAGETRREGKLVFRSFRLTLVEGENRVRVTASSADGSWESDPAEVVLRYEQPLDKPTLHLISIGVSRYAEGSYRLKYARHDAESLAGLFRQRGSSLYGQVEVATLLDDQATGRQIRETMQRTAQGAKPQDTLLLFLAGHGAMVGQRYYFIPYDFQIHRDASRDEEIRRQGLPADVLADFLSLGPALKRILILDTCASGGAVDLFQVASRNPFGFRGEIERLARSHGVYMIGASAATEEAKESEALGHGVLTYALLAGLRAVERGPLERKWVQPQNPQQVVDVLEWFSYASGHVPNLTKEFCGQEQNVHTAGRGSSFPVLPLLEP